MQVNKILEFLISYSATLPWGSCKFACCIFDSENLFSNQWIMKIRMMFMKLTFIGVCHAAIKKPHQFLAVWQAIRIHRKMYTLLVKMNFLWTDSSIYLYTVSIEVHSFIYVFCLFVFFPSICILQVLFSSAATAKLDEVCQDDRYCHIFITFL